MLWRSAAAAAGKMSKSETDNFFLFSRTCLCFDRVRKQQKQISNQRQRKTDIETKEGAEKGGRTNGQTARGVVSQDQANN